VDVHRPLVRRHPGSTRPHRTDGVVAEDDLLTTRLRCCTIGGRRPGILEQALVSVDDLAVATVRCLRCRDNDPQMTSLPAFLVQRYGPGHWSTP
jgi:hypothetical protein